MLTLQRVLVPTDFSEGAAQAYDLAALVAEWFDAERHVLHVTGDPTVPTFLQNEAPDSKGHKRFVYTSEWLDLPVENPSSEAIYDRGQTRSRPPIRKLQQASSVAEGIALTNHAS